jgi:pimeloyl-ACP methyl ester carboxylesterase
MALDDRIVAAAPSCYLTSLERLFATIGPQDAEQNITGQVAFGMEHADYVTMREPQATLMCVATKDAFDIDGAWTTFREAKLLYGKLGYGERVSLFEFNDGHGFSKPRREAALRWMRRRLLQQDDAPFEENSALFTDSQLQCTRSGQVLEDFKGKSAFHFNAQRGKELALARAERSEGLTRSGLLQTVLRRPSSGPGKARQRSVLQRSGYQIATRIYETEPGVRVPGLEYIPAQPNSSPRVVYLHGRGMAAEAGAGGALEKLVLSGHRVLALDLRGIGETAPAGGAKAHANAFGVDWKEAFLGLHLDRPLLGQRVFDLLQVLNMERAENMHLIGVEAAGPIALHAALDRRIGRLTLERALVSWASVVENPISRQQLANVIPGVLKDYDLPELAALLAPLPLTIREPVDGMGRPTSRAELDRRYTPCRAAYAKREAGKDLVLRAAP